MEQRLLKKFARAILAVCLFGAASSFGQTGYTISTFAGTGTSGFAEGAVAAAQFASPYGVAVDNSGNLYIIDSGNQRIRKVSNGTVSTVAGNGTPGFSGDTLAATGAMLSSPAGIAVDGSGNLYIADTNNGLIRKVDSKGNINTIAGNINSPASYADNPVATLGYLSQPVGIAADSSGNVYFSESSNIVGASVGNNRIRKISSGGALTTVANLNGAVGSFGDGLQATAARLNNPLGLALDKSGSNLYFVDNGNNKIRKIDLTTGIITTVAGNGTAGFSGDGDLAFNAQLNNPTGVSVDSAGNLYIADNRNFRIRKVTADGKISTIAGRAASGYTGDLGPATSATLRFPTGTAVDANGNVYVADNQNNVIRLLTPPAGSGGTGLPAINAGGVVSAGDFGGYTSISPGSWVEIYGTNLAASTATWVDPTNLFTGLNNQNAPTSINRTSVTIGGLLAFPDYVSPTQVNVQIPSNVPTGSQPIVVITAAGSSTAYNINVNTSQPGLQAPALFKVGGKQYVVATLADGSYVLPPNAIPGLKSRQAKPGETMVIYGVGFGPVIPATSAGQVVSTLNSLGFPFQLSVGGAPAVLNYYGLAPSLIGTYQFNVVVPAIPDSDAVPVTFTLNGNANSQTLFTAVKN